MPSMVKVTLDGTRIEQLQQLALVIAQQIDDRDDTHSMAQLARQYRETVAEIDYLRGSAQDDGIDDLLDG